MSSHCSLIRNPWSKPTGVLEHCREGETTCWFYIFQDFPSDSSLRRRRMSMYNSLFTVAIPLNYTNEFRKLLEATTYIGLVMTVHNLVPEV